HIGSNCNKTQKMQLPALITVAKDINQPRLLSYRLKLATEDREIKILSYQDLKSDNDNNEDEFFGLDGSPTQVERIFPPKHDIVQETWEGSPSELAKLTVNKLKELRYL
ncbi:MAG TPA: electron transfer flavoprotein subunit beta, partial [Firmicutes bacterium]|nr:electron transfer flavoprotein subunit beta [Bacillota bacterium]